MKVSARAFRSGLAETMWCYSKAHSRTQERFAIEISAVSRSDTQVCRLPRRAVVALNS